MFVLEPGKMLPGLFSATRLSFILRISYTGAKGGMVMSTAIHITTTVSTDGKIEISAPELRSGMTANITIVIDDEQAPKRSALDILAELPGHRLFQTAEEVDAYIHEERDAWDR
jgi:hypothetical protein